MYALCIVAEQDDKTSPNNIELNIIVSLPLMVFTLMRYNTLVCKRQKADSLTIGDT